MHIIKIKIKTKNMTGEHFSEAFADFYTDNIEKYGETEEGLETAYNDFIQVEGMDEEAINSEIDAFSEFYSDLVDVYGDTDEGIEEAYNDFVELSNAETAEEEYYNDEDEFSELEERFMEFYSDTADIYGDTDEGIEEAYNDFVEALNETSEDMEYSAEDETEAADTFYSQEELLEEFADFYADTEELYGDDIEAAFDDYTDALDAIALEDQYSNKHKNIETAKSYGRHALAGAGAGAVIAGTVKYAKNVGENSTKMRNRRDYLLSKGTANLDAKEHAELADLKEKLQLMRYNKDNNKGVSKAMAQGAGYGAATGVAAKALSPKFNFKQANYSDESHEEDEYGIGDSIKSGWNKTKDGVTGAAKKATSTTGGKMATLGVAGGATGAIIGAATDPNSKERKALKAKVKAGTATNAEKVKLAELQKARRNRIMKSTAIGAGTGAVAGAGPKAVDFAKNKFGKKKEALPAVVDKAASAEDATLEGEKETSYAGLTGKGKDRDFSAGDKRPVDAGSYVTKLIKG
jgi:hypothetical protein